MITPTSGVTGQVKLMGLSTDTKPTTGIANGSSFYEMDTKHFFFFDEDGARWIQQ